MVEKKVNNVKEMVKDRVNSINLREVENNGRTKAYENAFKEEMPKIEETVYNVVASNEKVVDALSKIKEAESKEEKAKIEKDEVNARLMAMEDARRALHDFLNSKSEDAAMKSEFYKKVKEFYESSEKGKSETFTTYVNTAADSENVRTYKDLTHALEYAKDRVGELGNTLSLLEENKNAAILEKSEPAENVKKLEKEIEELEKKRDDALSTGDTSLIEYCEMLVTKRTDYNQAVDDYKRYENTEEELTKIIQQIKNESNEAKDKQAELEAQLIVAVAKVEAERQLKELNDKIENIEKEAKKIEDEITNAGKELEKESENIKKILEEVVNAAVEKAKEMAENIISSIYADEARTIVGGIVSALQDYLSTALKHPEQGEDKKE